ncbi:MAG TPA: hypothetical protein VFU94_08925 [Conexibacter sp.]|nr:hypothetical protein [Conexibacter sp.]
MSRSRRLPVLLACAAAAGALSAPAALAAAHKSVSSNGHGVVLGVSGHTVRLVGRGHRVSDVHVTSTHGLRRGEVVTVHNGHAHVTGRVGKVSFLGRVVRSSGHGAVVRLGDGSTLRVGGGGKPRARRASASAASVTIDFQGLTPGQALLVTIATDAQGNVAITIRVLPSSTNIGDNELDVTGVVTDDTGDGEFAIRAGDGSGLRFQDPQRLLEAADASQCDEVEVGYHRDGSALVADTLRVTGQSSDGSCADNGNTTEVDGVVTALAGDGSSLTVQPDDGSPVTTIPVDDPSVLDGISVGDDVAVTLDGSGTAVDVEPIDNSSDPGGDGSSGSGGGDQ